MSVSYERLLWLMSGQGNATQQANLVDALEDAGGLYPLIGTEVDLGEAWRPLSARPSGDVIYNANDVLANVSGFSVTVAANTWYKMECLLIFDGNGTGSGGSDFKVGFTGPSGATLDWHGNGLHTSATAGDFGQPQRRYRTIAQVETFGTTAIGSKVTAAPFGFLKVGATAGTFQVQASQGTSTAANTTLFDESELILTPYRFV